MILAICGPGHIAEAIRDAAELLREPLRTAGVTDPDLFNHALGCRAIIYAPEACLLDAGNVSEPERMRAVVKASHAPGVSRVVVVFPEGNSWHEEALVLQRDGVGYTILRSRPLVDELADATNLHAARSVWLPRGETVNLVSRRGLAFAIQDAITRDDLCGATVDVSADRMEVAEAIRYAANVAGADVRVHAASPGISFAMRKLSLWMGLEPPALEGVIDRLGTSSQDASTASRA